MNKTVVTLLFCLSLFFAPITFAGGGGGGGGGGSSVPSLHMLGQLAFIVCIAFWYRKPK